jgi:hypothetical protein
MVIFMLWIISFVVLVLHGVVMQEHRSNVIKRAFNGRREVQPSRFSNFEKLY